MIATTLGRIRAAEPCADGWRHLLVALGEGGDPDLDRTVTLAEIVASNGVEDALWVACHAVTLTAADERVLRLFAADCAERALCAEREAGREPDARSWAAVEAARAYARGEIGAEELRAAYAAACDAGWAAVDAARVAAAVYAAHSARDAAWGAAAWAARAAAYAASAATAAYAAYAAADAVCAERDWQAARLLAYLRGEVNA